MVRVEHDQLTCCTIIIGGLAGTALISIVYIVSAMGDPVPLDNTTRFVGAVVLVLIAIIFVYGLLRYVYLCVADHYTRPTNHRTPNGRSPISL